jgi:hypothetical protein
MASKTFELMNPHRECEVTTDDFQPGSPGSYWEPPDGPEWSPQNIVAVTFYHEVTGQKVLEDYVTWETFLLDYAVEHKLTLSKADDAIMDAMVEVEYENLDDGCGPEDYDDDADRRFYGD